MADSDHHRPPRRERDHASARPTSTGEVVVGGGPIPDHDLDALTVVHADMDAFYASIAVLQDPTLAGKPLLVGGTGPRGVVASASYEARLYGCRSAMPMAAARRLCPQALVVPPDFATYRKVSALVMEVFRAVTPLVEPLALDEAFLDVRGARRRLGSVVTIARALRRQVRQQTGLTVTIGLAGSKFLAKLASTRGKPDGLLVIPPSRALAYLHPLEVEVLPGVGGATLTRLRRYGVRTVGDLARTPRRTLEHTLGSLGATLAELAWARDPRPVVPDEAPKSVGAEETYPVDLTDREPVTREILRCCVRVGRRLRAAGLVGRTITLKVRFADFHTVTRSRTLPVATDTDAVLRTTCAQLLAATGWQPGRPVRLLGVSVSGLQHQSEPAQLQLGLQPDGDQPGWRAADRAADAVRARFGDDALGPAALAAPPQPPNTAKPASRATPQPQPHPAGSSSSEATAFPLRATPRRQGAVLWARP